MEYHSQATDGIDHVKSTNSDVKEFVRFYNKDYEMLEIIEQNLARHGYLKMEN